MSLQQYKRGPPTFSGGLLESETEPSELSVDFIFCCPGFLRAGLLVTFPALGFLRVRLPLWEILPSWASAVLGLLLAGATLRLFQPA